MERFARIPCPRTGNDHECGGKRYSFLQAFTLLKVSTRLEASARIPDYPARGFCPTRIPEYTYPNTCPSNFHQPVPITPGILFSKVSLATPSPRHATGSARPQFSIEAELVGSHRPGGAVLSLSLSLSLSIYNWVFFGVSHCPWIENHRN